jgi:hypothetical protein
MEAYSKHAELKYETVFEDNQLEVQEGEVKKWIREKL